MPSPPPLTGGFAYPVPRVIPSPAVAAPAPG
jgi:hypothetical protein